MHVLVWNGTVVSKILYHNTSGLLPFSVSIEKSGVMLIDLHWYVIWSFLLQLLIVFVCSVCLVFSLSIFIILGISKSNVPPFMGRELLVRAVYRMLEMGIVVDWESLRAFKTQLTNITDTTDYDLVARFLMPFNTYDEIQISVSAKCTWSEGHLFLWERESHPLPPWLIWVTLIILSPVWT